MQTFLLFGILINILKKGKTTTQELANEFEVSRRTILRYLDKLAMAGVPLYGERGKNGGISIMKDYVFDKSFFTPQEKDFLCCELKSGNTENKQIARQILQKLI